VVEALAGQAIALAVSLEAPAVQGDDVSRRTADGRLYGTREGSVRYATRETVLLEATAAARAAERVPGLSSNPALVSVFAGLSVDQVAAMRTLVGSDCRATTLLAPAGAGKTTSLRVAREVWESDGRTVRAIAPTGKAASGLVDEGAAASADTIATVLGRVRRGETPGWGEGDVVVVDEAGMVGSLTLATLLEQAQRAGAQLVLVGDPEQLQPVGEAAGLFELLADDLPDTARLGEVWRQHDPEERAATLGLRGDATEREQQQAVGWYRDHGRVMASDVTTVLEDVTAAWKQSVDEGNEAVMFAPTWNTADALAAAAQAHQLARGRVDHRRTIPLGDINDYGQRRGTGRVAGVGDLVMTRANDYTLRTSTGGVVRNGQTWTVTRINGDTARVTLTRTGPTGEAAIVPASYLADHARLAYGISLHQAQGVTVDTGFSILDGSTSGQNDAYTALTRGRVTNKVFIAAAAPDAGVDPDHGPAPQPFRADRYEAADLLDDIINRARRDRAAHHVLGDAISEGRRNQEQRYDPATVDEFQQAGMFTSAAIAARERDYIRSLARTRPRHPHQPAPYSRPDQGHGIGR